MESYVNLLIYLGFPNVGKSSVINGLMGKKVCILFLCPHYLEWGRILVYGFAFVHLFYFHVVKCLGQKKLIYMSSRWHYEIFFWCVCYSGLCFSFCDTPLPNPIVVHPTSFVVHNFHLRNAKLDNKVCVYWVVWKQVKMFYRIF
jgi:hypothetical protein